jgi:hypothetical protein
MCHYVTYPDHHSAACGAMLAAPATTKELDPEQTDCSLCRMTLAWIFDIEALAVLRAIDSGAHDVGSIAERIHRGLAVALTIVERLQKCHQVLKSQTGRIDREVGK